MRQIHVRDYGIIPGDEKETTLKLRKMLQEIRQEENLEIRFEKGIYHFYPDYAGEKLLYISNHDEDTIKKVAFDLSGMKQVKISGTDIFCRSILTDAGRSVLKGSQLTMHGPDIQKVKL